MKILMMGLGSIGQRHVRNIRKVLGEEAELLAYRARGAKMTFTDKLEIREGVDLEEEYRITSYTDLEEALAQKPEIAFVTNITAKHMECAIRAAKAGCHLLIEKPLAADLQGTEELARIVKEKQLTVFMGFQNRYHPCVEVLKETIGSGMLGRIAYVSCEFSERLTTMHRYEDYRQTYMARQDMGGGPVLNLQMHDLDILQWIFGVPQSVTAVLQRKSSLQIDVEESASAVFRAADGFPVYTHTDFLQYPPVHCFKAAGTEGRIEVDLNTAEYAVWMGDERIRSGAFQEFQRNDMFVQELEDFLAAVQSGRAPKIGLQSGIDTLRMAMAIKRADAEGREVRLTEV
ncbi:MAG: Gfo/Idh/MocA family oxidoreductase [Lachnospiraceae bacterium]|nr:Gfo/Idh/MocA family oxidoreductase [Lachnospiraceae bacterium]